ncbi:MAG: glycosyltransferase family 39 protein [Nocardiaceae bacterium]|nr:glycosyltransferase family 39 protein [Nocardiaceae bacterium]
MKWRSVAVFAGAFAGYLAAGLWLAIGHQFILGDALARVAAARAVVLSRDAHVAALGFIFTPLTALVQIPLTVLSSWWPGVTRWAVSGVVTSAVFMAGAVVQVRGIGLDRGVPGRLTTLVTTLFALTPMIVFYGANGMSEAPFVFFICWAMRRLIRWTSTDDVSDLMVVGSSLGLAYLVRYDGIVAAASASLFVGALAVRRHTGPLRDRLVAARIDVILVAGPPVFAFLFWVAVSWLLTGEGFAQFTSVYGNAAILAESGATRPTPAAGIAFALTECIVLAPGLLVIAPIAFALGVRRRELAAFVPVVICAPIVAFQVLSYLSGSTFGLLRFYISVIPWLATAVLLLPQRRLLPPSRRPGAFSSSDLIGVPARGLAAMGVVALTAGIAVGGWGMAQPQLAPQEYALSVVLSPDSDDHDVALRDRKLAIAATFGTERQIADYLDSRDLPDGSVLVDSVYGFAVTTASRHPSRFVIPSDRDFVTILNDPARSGVQYLLTVPPSGRGTSDALNRRYPTLYADGAGIALLELEAPNDGADQPRWRLYRVMPPRR